MSMTKAQVGSLAVAVTLLLAAVVLSTVSCSILMDEPFAVVAWEPGEGYKADPAGIKIALGFSTNPDRTSVENAFNLSQDGQTLDGTFSWDGAKLCFNPYAGFRQGAEYRLSLTIDAMDEMGLSLAHAFDVRFSTKEESDRPSVLSTDPANQASLLSEWATIEICYSESIDPLAYREAVTFSPAVTGSWAFSEGGATATFRPAQPWRDATEYSVNISADLKDLWGNRMGTDYRFRFFSGADRIAPFLDIASAIDENEISAFMLLPDGPDDGEFTVNGGWEAFWRLQLVFSEPVRLSSLATRIVVEGCAPPVLETTAVFSDIASFRFDERPPWGDLFSVRVRDGYTDVEGNAATKEVVYRMRADGVASRPPRWVGLRLPLAPGEVDPGFRNLTAFPVDEPYAILILADSPESYPTGISVPTSIELYLELAEGAEPDLFSIMERFRVSATNGALDFSPCLVSTGGFAYASPYPPWSSCALVRIDGVLTNRLEPGMVTVSLGAGLSDSRGNIMREAAILPLVQ
ncbi:MAG: hypothetical protein E4H20_06725 [Spirochaetales bacterium]|nr:MAG: hypothetical protein E4H20_06725 [Spirochaetales bacterium]